MKARAIPLTASGWTVAVLAVVAYGAGWLLGWVELMVLAAGCLIVLAVALPFVIGRLALDVERTLEPQRVTVGGTMDWPPRLGRVSPISLPR